MKLNNYAVYVTGSSIGNGTGSDIATVSYTYGGIQNWVARFDGGSAVNDIGKDIAADNINGVYVAGSSYNDMITLKYDNSGTQLWSNFVRGGIGNAISIFRRPCYGFSSCYTIDVFVVGQTFANSHAEVIKYFDNGVKDWERYPIGLGVFYASSIDNSENLYATGTSFSLPDKSLTCKYDKNGYLMWSHEYIDNEASSSSHSIKVDANGNSYVTGFVIDPNTNNDYLTIKYGNLGNNKPINMGPDSEIPEYFLLEQNYPNPFNPSSVIRFGIPYDANVKLRVYDFLGKEVLTLINEFKTAGYYSAKIEGSNLVSGVYFYRLEAGNLVESKKMVLIK